MGALGKILDIDTVQSNGGSCVNFLVYGTGSKYIHLGNIAVLGLVMIFGIFLKKWVRSVT